ncbi:MAG: LysR family transcriptional regulator [Burkholderiales bacterium]|nr:LysR family transcriptional regulator [Burkholderiales bacterium]ODU66583.1 MAG: hypothetical protein ABT05_04980 [Lautropia sp. SCN 66-9]
MTDLRQLRHFIALAETLNYRAAAQRLHMAQPPLSASIRKLESQLGCQLFERNRRGTLLTRAGQAALVDARRVLAELDQFEASVRNAANGLAGTLTVGYVASTTYEVLPRVLPMFRAACPAVRLKLVEQPSMGVLDLVENREADIGLLRMPLGHATHAQMAHLHDDPFIAALPDTPRWRASDSIHLSELADEPFVIYSAQFARSTTMLACQQAGFTPQVSQEASGVPTVVSLVKCGLGVALVPGVARVWPMPGVVFKRLRGVSRKMQMGLAVAWLAEMDSPLMRRFREVLRQAYPRASAALAPGADTP